MLHNINHLKKKINKKISKYANIILKSNHNVVLWSMAMRVKRFRYQNSLLFVRKQRPLLWNKQHYSDLHYHVSDKRLSSVFSQLNNCYWYFSISMATLTLKAVIVSSVRPRPLLQLTAEFSHWRGNQKKPTFKCGIRGREPKGGVLSCNTFCCGFPVSSRGKEGTLKWRHMWCS